MMRDPARGAPRAGSGFALANGGRAFRHRNYRLFFGGQVVSVSGTWMQNIATAWLVLELTHSPVAVGILAAFQFLPYTVFGLFAGVLVDRLDVRRTIIATQVMSMIFAFALAGLTLGGIVTVWEVYLLTGLRGTVLVLDAPARQALTYQMVGRDELPNAVALNSSLFNAARVVGPAVGGLIVAAAGPGACFLINGLSFLAVLYGLLRMRVSELFPVDTSRRPTSVTSGRTGLIRRAGRTSARPRSTSSTPRPARASGRAGATSRESEQSRACSGSCRSSRRGRR